MLRNFKLLPQLSGLAFLAFTLVLLTNSAQSTSSQGSQDANATNEQNPSTGVPAAKVSDAHKTEPAASMSLTLGVGDEVEVTVYGAPDLSVHTRVSADGNISVPLVGYIRVAGLTSSEAEGTIEVQLRQKNILKDPQVSVFVREYTNSGVSVAGEVAKPGSYTTLGPHRLFDLIQAAGGLTEKAANRAVISHRGSDETTTVELSRDSAHVARNNIEIQPGDTVVVPAAPIVYVLGEVNKPGGYVLNSTNGVTLLRVVAAAGGPTHDASVGSTTMLRTTPSGLQQLRVPLKNILRAKAPDMPVQAEDIIYVPRSRVKAALQPGALLTAAATVAIYRAPF